MQINKDNLPIFDSHAHFDDKAFEGDLSAVVNEMKANGVVGVINNAVNYTSAKKCIDLANRYDIFYSAVGVHPEDLYDGEDFNPQKLIPFIDHPKTVAIGEIGLDYYYDNSLRENQRKWFDVQLDIASGVGMPVCIHSRDAMKDTIDILSAHKDVGGIIHCYSGSVESARILLDMGYYISFAGPVTFKNASVALEVIKYVPCDRMLIETDSPYLAPVPYRGKRNCPVYVSEVASKIAEIKNMNFEKVADITLKKAKNVYAIQ